MKTLLAVCLALGLAVLCGGCASSPQARIAKNQEAFNAYPAEVRTAIQRGEVVVGFTPEQAKLALGEPDRVITRTGGEGNAEIWIYRESSPRFGLGMGVGMNNGSMGTGLGVGLGGREFPDERMRVIFMAGRVTAVEQVSR